MKHPSSEIDPRGQSRVVDLEEKFSLFDELWSPRLVAELNGQYVKLAKVKGEFPWHAHQHEDELFLVVKGRLGLRFRDREVTLEPGQLYVVPRGVEHQPHAEEEVHLVLFEPRQTAHTGELEAEVTVAVEDQVWL